MYYTRKNVEDKKSNKKIYIFLLVFPLFILAAFRAPSVGNDTLNYYKSYLTVSQEAFFHLPNHVWK